LHLWSSCLLSFRTSQFASQKKFGSLQRGGMGRGVGEVLVQRDRFGIVWKIFYRRLYGFRRYRRGLDTRELSKFFGEARIFERFCHGVAQNVD
jgi:hypothetical protein